MALTYGIKPIVNNGLILALDAGNHRSYPGSGTTWYDLIVSDSGTLTNGPTFNSSDGGSIVFDGSNDYVNYGGNITTSEATFITWIKRNGTQTLYTGLIFNRGASVTGLNFYSTTHNIGYHWNGAVNTYSWDSGLTVPDLQWCMVAISISSSSAIAYLCQSSGITSATNSVSHSSTTLNVINIGADTGTSRYLDGNLAIAQIYNRALSLTEITQNFEVVKSRFGL